MINTIFFFLHYTLVLLFGLVLSAALAGVRLSQKNIRIIFVLFALCGLVQTAVYVLFNEMLVWRIYPLITHLPTVLLLCLYYRKRIVTAIAAVTSAYLLCQPAKWFGLFLEALTEQYVVGQIAQIITLLTVGFIAIRYLGSYISEIYTKDNRSVLIFGIIPIVYYLFDYTMGIYTDFWISNNRITAEFLPFFLCIVYFIFCIVYYKEYEKKSDAERKEQIIRITAEQQAKEREAVLRNEQELRLLRHDMRLFLSSLAICIDDGDARKAKEMISTFSSHVEGTALKRFCENSTVNYILSDFASRCGKLHVEFIPTVEIAELVSDEIMFASILSNALDNALNAQKDLPEDIRYIKLMLKTFDDKLLLSVKNPFKKKPVFVDGLPISGQKGHGYGTQSIRYMTERLGGNCQFTVQDKTFLTQVII
ncbi:MAG: GHKL domain-containing protein [Lachnospiraceae bacterium]|nr:GHKL domain-containing protein [Lachnospiraceae bacterium]